MGSTQGPNANPSQVFVIFMTDLINRWSGTENVFLQDFLLRKQLVSSPPVVLAESQTFKNSLYVRTSSVGLDLHLENSEGAPGKVF